MTSWKSRIDTAIHVEVALFQTTKGHWKCSSRVPTLQSLEINYCDNSSKLVPCL